MPNEKAGSKFNLADDHPAPIAQKTDTLYEKQKGAHVFHHPDSGDFQFLTRNHIEWVTLVPWAFQDDFDSPILNYHNGDSVNIKRAAASWLAYQESFHTAGFKIFVKPHVWLNDPSEGKWRSDIFPNNEVDWDLWKENYRDFILFYAKLAQQGQAEMFCIGTEFSRLTIEKPAFWAALSREVRSIYDGKICYAANWYEEFEEITFWDELDYIGIQAYFPLTKNEFPTVEQLSRGWDQYIPDMAAIHKKFNRKILFTEMGYKATADAAIKPWEWLEHASEDPSEFSQQTQANCYEAFFHTVWEKDWFAGVHIWQFRGDYKEDKRVKSRDFSPQGKAAEAVIAKGFESDIIRY